MCCHLPTSATPTPTPPSLKARTNATGRASRPSSFPVHSLGQRIILHSYFSFPRTTVRSLAPRSKTNESICVRMVELGPITSPGQLRRSLSTTANRTCLPNAFALGTRPKDLVLSSAHTPNQRLQRTRLRCRLATGQRSLIACAWPGLLRRTARAAEARR